MDEVEQYLDQVCRSLRGSSSLLRHLREELREHLTEAIEAHVAEGMSRADAAARAIAEFGTPAIVGEGLEAVYGRRLFSVVVEKAMAWKERTMKTGWKWSFVAQLALGMVIVAQLALVAMIVTYVMPVVGHQYDRAGQPRPEIIVTALSLVRFFHDTWFVWVGALAAGAAALELFYRGESKNMIRLTAEGGVALALMGLIWLVCFATTAPLGIMVRSAYGDPPESRVLRHAAEAETGYRRLVEAVEREHWPDVVDRARELADSFEHLREFGPAAPVLLALHRQDDVDRLRVLLERLEDTAETVIAVSGARDPAAVAPPMQLLREAHDELATKADGWPSAESAGEER